jgi:Na+/proline symporter
MAVVQINKNPSRRDLLVFASILPIFFGLFGALRWHAGETKAATIAWGVGAALSLVAFGVPPARRWLYLGWMYAVFPIAWTVSHAILVVVYYLVATPIALVMRAFGRDPMYRRFDKAAKSYWVLRQPNRDTARYFRQF